MSKSYASLACLSIAATTLFSACDKEKEATPTATTNLSTTINGAQQVPVNPSTATGNFVGKYDSGTKLLTYTLTYQGFTPSVAHIHVGGPGVNGPVAIPFANLTSPITGSVTLTPDQADKIVNNGMYVNMHSTASPNGEIRGDIRK